MDRGHRRAGGIAAFARSEWRARGRSHVVIALLAGMTVAVVLTTLCAAERSLTAFDRLREATHASDATAHLSSGNPEQSVREVRQVAGVIDARAMSTLYLRPAGTELTPGLTLTAIAPRTDDRVTRVDTPLVTEGRAPRPDRAGEVALSASLADDLDVEVGDEVRLETMTEEWLDAAFSGQDPGRPDGPTVAVTVTGITLSPFEFGPQASMIHLTPAFIDRYEGQLLRDDFIHARLEPEALVRFRNDELLLLRGSPQNESAFIDRGQSEDGLRTIATALRIVGVVAGMAGSLSLALALARASRVSAADRSTLVALGWTRWDERRALALAFTPSLVVGLTAGVAVGISASPRMMVGLARRIDPDRDAVLVSSRLVLAVTAGAIAVAAVLLVLIAVLANRRSSGGSTRIVGFPVGRPLVVSLGLRHALVAPADRGGRASRGAMAAVAGATAVALAALVVSSSIARLQHDPSLTGERPERLIDAGFSFEAFDGFLARMEADDRVAVLAGQHVANITMEVVGHVFLLIYDTRRGELDAPVTEGRMPRTADEVALGPATAEAAGAEIGDEVTLSGLVGSARYRIVGTVLFPEGDFAHDDGVTLTVDGARSLVGDPDVGAVISQVFFEWEDGVDAEAADRELAADGVTVVQPREGLRIRPGTVTNLGQVEHLPRQLALLVGMLAVATLLHAAWTGVVLRARELVTLRALGMTRRSTALSSAMQPIAIVAFGVLVGAPIGVAIGRLTWRPIAEDAHLLVRPILSWPWFGVLVAAAAVAGFAVAGLAGRWAAHLCATTHLRTE